MSVVVTPTELLVIPNSGIQPLGSQPGSAQAGVDPVTGYQAWVMYGKDTGDGTGGGAIFNFTIPQSAWYYTWTALYTSRDDTGVSVLMNSDLIVESWEVFRGENGAMNSNVNVNYEMTTGRSSTSMGANAFLARYLGRPLVAAVINVALVNTDTIKYDVRIAGLRSLRPGIPWYDALQQGELL